MIHPSHVQASNILSEFCCPVLFLSLGFKQELASMIAVPYAQNGYILLKHVWNWLTYSSKCLSYSGPGIWWCGPRNDATGWMLVWVGCVHNDFCSMVFLRLMQCKYGDFCAPIQTLNARIIECTPEWPTAHHFATNILKKSCPVGEAKHTPTHATRLQPLNPRAFGSWLSTSLFYMWSLERLIQLCVRIMPSIKPELDPRLQLISSPVVIILSVSGRFTCLTRGRSNQTVNVEFSAGTFDYRVRSTSSSAVAEMLCAAPCCWKFY